MRQVSFIVSNTKIDNSKSGVVAIPRCKLLQSAILDAALKTHKDLSDDDREFARSEILKLDLRDQELAKFILQIYKLTNTGRFSLTYNLDLDNHIQARISERIKTLVKVSGDEKAWPELYNNPYLVSEEKESIETMSNREYYAILNTLENARTASDFETVIPCKISKSDTLSLDKNGIKYTSIYSKCYDNVCISESGQSGKIVAVKGGDIPQIAYIADGNGKNNRYCFKMIDLVEQLAKGDYINPRTGLMFSEIALSQMLIKYEKEIKMYKRHMDILRRAGFKQ